MVYNLKQPVYLHAATSSYIIAQNLPYICQVLHYNYLANKRQYFKNSAKSMFKRCLNNHTILYGNDSAAAFRRFRGMRYHDDRLAGCLIDFPKQTHNLRSGLAVQVSCGLICKEDLRIANQGAGDCTRCWPPDSSRGVCLRRSDRPTISKI